MMVFYEERLLTLIEQGPYSPLTKKAYRSDVRHLCRNVTRIDVPSMQRYGTLLRTSYASTTVARRLHALSTLFDQLVTERSLAHNPLAQTKRHPPIARRRPRFSYDEVRSVLERITDETIYAFCFLLLHTGLRFAEAHALRLTDIDWDTKQLFVRHGKGGRMRHLPLHDELHRVLLRYLETTSIPSQELFSTETGRRFPAERIRSTLREASLTQLGRILRPHDLRVTFATTLYHEHETDVLTIMRLLGHRDVRTTQHYILPSSDIDRASVNRLKPTTY